MTFASPAWLLLLPILVLLPWAKKRPMSFSSVQVLSQTQTWRQKMAVVVPMFASVGIAFLTIALARPVTENQERVIDKEGIDIMLAVDVSGSMNAKDFRQAGVNQSRMDISKKVLEKFILDRSDDRLGMVLFGEQAYTYVPLTLERDGIIGFVRSVEVGLAGDGATAIGDGIAIAAQRLIQRKNDNQIIIVLTDGRNNIGMAPVVAAQAAAKLGIRVYSIGIGTENETAAGRFTTSTGINKQVLEMVATTSDGRFYHATDAQSLEAVYEEIDQLEPTTAQATVYTHRTERAFIWMLCSLLCWIMVGVLSETWLRRIP